jgi:bifunctional DNA-binding transcriptional regulator/antitoxin component of YhaV-PrlF toxin-antitoxin module
MISNKQLFILIVGAAALVLAVLLLYGGDRSQVDLADGSEIAQGLAPEAVYTIAITRRANKNSGSMRGPTSNEAVTLRRDGEGFAITDRGGFPATKEAVNAFFIKIADIRAKAKITDDKANYGDLGVADNSPGAVTVNLYGKPDEGAEDGADGKLLLGLVIGKRPEKGRGVYVRRVGRDTVYVTDGFLRVESAPADYLGRDLLDIKAADIQSVTVTKGDSKVVVARDKDKKAVLQNIPKDREAKQTEVDDLLKALEGLTLADVAVAKDIELKWDTTYTAKLGTGQTYTVKLAEKDSKHYVALSAKGSGLQGMDFFPNRDAPQAELDKNDKRVTAERNAIAFGPEHAGWAYELNSWVAGKMRKTLDDLAEVPPPHASHILIGYKGASRSKATRTKEEAKALAETALKEAQAKGADFAALAKKYSDGPTKTRGGNLGPVKKGVMAPPFEKALYLLQPGQTSGLVETDFGFHVIKRTK